MSSNGMIKEIYINIVTQTHNHKLRIFIFKKLTTYVFLRGHFLFRFITNS